MAIETVQADRPLHVLVDSPPAEMVHPDHSLHIARDFSVGAAVILYFTGFAYLDQYLDEFGIPKTGALFTPQYVIVFAYDVVRRYWWAAMAAAAIFLVYIYVYHLSLLNLTSSTPYGKLHERAKSPESATLLSRLQALPIDLQRFFVMFVTLILILASFPISFSFAKWAAFQDAAGIRLQAHAHQGDCFPDFYKFVVADSVTKASPTVGTTVRMLNAAAEVGDVVPIFETSDRLYLFQGTQVSDRPERDGERDTAFESEKRQNDRVYVVNKTLISWEAMWYNLGAHC